MNERVGLGLRAPQQRDRRLVAARELGQLDRLIEVLLAIDCLRVAAISSALMTVPDAACCSPAARPSMSAKSVSMAAIIS